jgi:hypothetical protein
MIERLLTLDRTATDGWVCAPCQEGDCRGCDITDGRVIGPQRWLKVCACEECNPEAPD